MVNTFQRAYDNKIWMSDNSYLTKRLNLNLDTTSLMVLNHTFQEFMMKKLISNQIKLRKQKEFQLIKDEKF